MKESSIWNQPGSLWKIPVQRKKSVLTTSLRHFYTLFLFPSREMFPLKNSRLNLNELNDTVVCPHTGKANRWEAQLGKSLSSLNFELNCLTRIPASGSPTDSTITQKSNLFPLGSPHSPGKSEKSEEGCKAQSPALLSKSRLPNEALAGKTELQPRTNGTTAAATLEQRGCSGEKTPMPGRGLQEAADRC